MNKIKRKLFSMEAILDSRTINDQLYFLVKWAGYPISQSTWEKADKVPADSNMISEYKMSVQMLGKTFYFDPLDQPPQIEDFVDIPPEKSELSTFNTKLSEFQHQINTLRDDVRFILQSQLKLIKELKMSKNAIQQYDILGSPASQEKQQSVQSDMMQQSASINYDGSFDQGDKVEKIGRAVQIKKSKTKMYYILWKRRNNGQIPKNSWVESEQMIENDPAKVCQYLWNKLI
ncbi:unnamed protein product (macronuclear) [Paramecium tetraurelia]|uniref:Chromo domain-containing protein n=1 Tax=Paramecium tetraurelia TaxID=5888 RepID=A0DHM5_PARTE|nr:uncharacterized protein GSPATT00016929001 [Paramecium tetraurelia]CAK82542.1 unnamed protein product [Paramecium tetraurelia]|eukprot:XP_001449939.1 hypothetical protein (macronuclear) [Paramecium tetraurelia strain d4-2]